MRARVVVTITASVLAVTTGVTAPGSAAAGPRGGAVVVEPNQTGFYHPVGPVRAVDTRTVGGPLGSGTVRKVDLAAFVPSTTANAVVLNLTATGPTASTFLTVYPDGTGRPTTSNLNVRAGETRSNSVTVALPANGSKTVDVYNLIGSTQVVVDVEGYYDPLASGGFGYFAQAPQRALDTRDGGIRLADRHQVDVSVPYDGSEGAGIGLAVAAVTITAVGPAGPGYLTAWNGVGAEPATSVVNYDLDPATPDFALVPVRVDADGVAHLTVEAHAAATDVVVDVVGVYADPNPASGEYLPATPTRVVDTRTSGGPLTRGASRTVVTPALSGGYVTGLNLNLTAVDATVPTYLTAWDPDAGPRPAVSTLNVAGAAPVAVAVQVGGGATDTRPGGNVAFAVQNLVGSVDVVGDLEGWFVADGG